MKTFNKKNGDFTVTVTVSKQNTKWLLNKGEKAVEDDYKILTDDEFWAMFGDTNV